MIPYGRQYIDEEDIRAVVEVLRSDFITQGPKIREFETALARTCGARYAVVFSSGTSALHGAYFALGLSEGDEFVVPSITFTATANAGLYLGAKPLFADVEPDTGNIDPSSVEELISPRTRLVVAVHYAGHPADMEKIREIADRYGLKVVEDACHALGARYREFPVGSCRYADAVVFSFHPVKHITTGEGGAVLTDDEEVYEKLLMFRNHGITRDRERFIHRPEGDWYYEVQLLGHNYRMTDIQAALGISQLRKLSRFVERRREIADTYRSAFEGNPHFEIPVEKAYAYHSYHLYPVRLRDASQRAEVFRRLREKGLGVQVHYIPVYRHPLYRELGYREGLCPRAEEFYSRVISLPVFPAMKDEEVERVIEVVKEVWS